ncbi:hypothetical protein SAMN05216503_2093 [Polaribacter sp. KT25b]|uniref:DUF6695 family protein n=1 Tax=Polaribacter sp. KT25b TaxID=1855336 RepID=UPI00087DE5B8|nr:DUF6695 family protein [Polaribacter sp. KT25b]SDS13946.1 hypothetical protein SAMN05216503_2093 [Polaribacter sp. KT25b]
MEKSELENAIIVILSYPDTVVRPAYWESSSKFWPKIGIGSEHAVQAGHAALLLIKKNESEIKYFDFGRYITSYGNGRVRSVATDPELHIPLKATFKNNKISNLDNILLWLEKHPEKTHGEGRLIASINDEINYDNALQFIHNLITEKEYPYGAFMKKASNCARFVTDTLIYSCTNKRITLKLKSSYLLTPSPIGNTLKGKTVKEVYNVKNQKIEIYKNRSILKEYNAAFFKKFDNQLNLIGTELPDIETFNLPKGTWLSGIGSGAWFHIDEKLEDKKYKISRHAKCGKKDFEGCFTVDNSFFDITKNYTFLHPSNCREMYIKQGDKKFIFKQLRTNF